jgi:hypothetical protein
MSKKLIKDSIYIVLITLGIILLFEVGLRFLYPQKGNFMFSASLLAYKHDQVTGIRLKPNIKKVYFPPQNSSRQSVEWETNENGFRGPSLQKDPSFRIMVYGDSNIQARFSPQNKTFSYLLEKKLTNQTNIESLEVINSGVVGFGPDQAYLKMRKDILNYKPNLVLLALTIENDFGDIIRNNIFRLDAKSAITFQSIKQKDICLLPSWHPKKILSTSLLIRAAVKINKKLSTNPELYQDQQEFLAYSKNSPLPASFFQDHYDLDLALNTDNLASSTKLELMKNILSETKKLCKNNDIALFVLIIPSIHDLTQHISPTFIELQQYPAYEQNKVSTLTESMLKTLQISHINLFVPFAENNPESFFFNDEGHWNNNGQEFAAKLVAKEISELEKRSLLKHSK